MLSRRQFLVRSFDCGLLEPAPSTFKRPAYATWKTFPKRT
jgi:hypothetical protein